MVGVSGALAPVALIERVVHVVDCWLNSRVHWLVLVEQQLDLSSATTRLRGVVLVGLHCSLACACGAVVGPFVRDCETER
ncbi:hypothetical protein Taro_015734 [Colocasia esculenta]|uniref:Uncharacterized protein n=1 Tax=Colocasia esculenta TaxID=4460 RepID=A0A843ULM3_COLES|nr:hypothetical protein [Colocasia esculenta]